MPLRENNRAPRIALAVLTLINLFNYLDRYVVSSLVESLKKSELRLSDTQLGSLMTGFILVYMLTSPVFGTLGDRRGRPRLLAMGVGIWSVATALGGLARSFAGLRRRRRGGVRNDRARASGGLFPEGETRAGLRSLLRGDPDRIGGGVCPGRTGGSEVRLAGRVLRGGAAGVGAGAVVPYVEGPAARCAGREDRRRVARAGRRRSLALLPAAPAEQALQAHRPGIRRLHVRAGRAGILGAGFSRTDPRHVEGRRDGAVRRDRRRDGIRGAVRRRLGRGLLPEAIEECLPLGLRV